MAKVEIGDYASKGLVRSLGKRAKVRAGDHIPKGLEGTKRLGKVAKVGAGDLHICDIPCPIRKVSK